MITSSALALIVPLLASGTRTDVAAAAESEAASGLSATAYNAPSSLQVDLTLTPLVGTRVMSKRTTFVVSYGPRLYVQLPNTADLGRPLVLHTLGSNYSTVLDRRTTFDASVRSGVGEVSYANLVQVFEPGSSTSRARIIPLVFSDANTSMRYRTGRRNRLDFGLGVGYQAPFDEFAGLEDDEEEGAAASGIPTSVNTSAAVSDTYAVTPIDQVTVGVRGGYLRSKASGGLSGDELNEVMIGAVVAGWSRPISPTSTLGTLGGWTITYFPREDRFDYFPTGVVSYVKAWQFGRQIWNSELSGGARGFLDRASGTYRAQGFVVWDLNGQIGRRWFLGTSVFGSTSLSQDPLVPSQYESTAGVAQQNTYVISRYASLRFGVRSALRGPHLRAEDDLTLQPEILGFVGLRLNVGTDNSQGAWLR